MNQWQKQACSVPKSVLKELEKRMYAKSSPYTEALDKVTLKLSNIMAHNEIVPDDEVSYRIRGRKKRIADILDKIQRNKYTVSSIKELEHYVDDIVGTRCIVDYISDVCQLKRLIQSSQEWKLAKPPEDYLRAATKTGYRSLHLVIVLDTTNFSDVLVEIQLRTTLQDAWATKTHPLIYKKKPEEIPQQWLQLFKHLSDSLYTHDLMFETIKREIKRNPKKEG